MFVRHASLLALLIASSATAFTSPVSRTAFSRNVRVNAESVLKKDYDKSLVEDIKKTVRRLLLCSYEASQDVTIDTHYAASDLCRTGSICGVKLQQDLTKPM